METMEKTKDIQIISATELPEEIKEAVCTVNVELNKKSKKLNIKDDLSIDYDNIEEEIETFPNKYFIWAMIYSEVKEKREVAEKKIRKRKGIIYEEIQKQGGKLRRSDITDLMETDELLDELEIRKMILDKQCQKLWFILESLKMKNDNLRSLAGFRKQELYQSSQSV